MLFELVQDLGGADRDGIGISHHGPAVRLQRIAPPELDRVERQRRCDFVDQHFQRRQSLQRAVAAHRARGDAAGMQRHRGDIDLGNVIDADRGGRGHHRDVGREILQAAAIQHMVGRESGDLAGGAIDADPAAHLDRVALDASLKLLIAVMRQAHRAAGKEHRRQRGVKNERGVVASAEAATDIGEMALDMRRPERRARLAQQKRDRLRRLIGRLHAEHQFEFLVVLVVPGEAGFRLQKHRIDRLGVELAVQHQQFRIVRGEFGADRIAQRGGLAVSGLGFLRERRPHRQRRILETFWADPAGLIGE